MDTRSPVNAVHDNIISKLEVTFSESLHIHDAQNSEHASEGDHIGNCDVGERNLREGFELQETKLEIKCLKECSTFPYPDMMLPSSSSDEEADASSPSKQSPRQNYSCSVSLPAPPKLVSAMKGSREKERGSQMKLTVKWAPDVYDPVPTLLSHTVKNKKQQKPRIKKSERKMERRARRSVTLKEAAAKINSIEIGGFILTMKCLKLPLIMLLTMIPTVELATTWKHHSQRFTGLLEKRCNMLGCVVYSDCINR